MNKKYIELALLAFVAVVLANTWDTQVLIVFTLIVAIVIIHTIENEIPRVQIRKDLVEIKKVATLVKPKVEPIKPVDERLEE